MDEELLTPSELYKWLKITRATAWKWREKGMPHIGSGKMMRYRKAEVEDWLRKRGEKVK